LGLDAELNIIQILSIICQEFCIVLVLYLMMSVLIV